MGMAISGMDKCDFIVYTEKGIDIVEVPFDADFWNDVFKTVSRLYKNYILSSLLLKHAQ